MTKGTKILIALAVVVAIVGAVVLLIPKSNNSSNTQSNNSSSDTSSTADVTINYDGTGFKLSAGKVKSGGTVKVVNDSTKNLDFESDPHPAHTNNTELNAGTLAPEKSVVFTLTTKGKWGFHNHLNASQKGELTVE